MATKQPAPALLSVFDGRNCVGCILRRGPAGVEAFTAADKSLGLFRNEDAAATALWQHAHGQPLAGENGDSR
jgi:hypothetical protein